MSLMQDYEKIGGDILKDVLKNPPKQDRDTVYYFSHERRVENAPEEVQDFINRKVKTPKVFAPFMTSLRSFTPIMPSGKANLVMLGGIAVLFAVIIIINLVINRQTQYTLEGNTISASAIRYEGKTFIVIKKQAETADAYTGAVEMAVSRQKPASADAASPIHTSRLYFLPEKNEEFRVSAPEEIENLLIFMRAAEEQVAIQITAD